MRKGQCDTVYKDCVPHCPLYGHWDRLVRRTGLCGFVECAALWGCSESAGNDSGSMDAGDAGKRQTAEVELGRCAWEIAWVLRKSVKIPVF